MLHQPELEFTVCAVRPVVEYTATGYSAEGQANYFNTVTQVTRAVLALPNRADRRAQAPGDRVPGQLHWHHLLHRVAAFVLPLIALAQLPDRLCLARIVSRLGF